MLLLRTDSLPTDTERWLYELKLDGYRAIAFKRDGTVHLRSRNDNDFSSRYPAVMKGLAKMPDNTVIDGEVIAFDGEGRPSFNALQNYGSAAAPVVYYVFDVMILAGRDVTREPLEKRRELLEKRVLPKLTEPARYASSLEASLPVLIQSVKAQGFEGLVAKRRNSVYEPGLRSGAWMKMRESGPGVRDRRLHARNENVRRAGVWVLRGRQIDLRREDAKRVHAGHARATFQEIHRAQDRSMPLRQPAGSQKRSMGTGADESKNGRMPVAEARARRAIRLS